MTNGRHHILLVEDNADDERLTLRALRRHNAALRITVARDGEEAVRTLERTAAEGFSMVLLDLKLPKLNGIEVLQHIREDESLKDLVVVVMTSSDEPTDVQACYRLHANSYVRKPVDYERFSFVVQQLGAYWLETNVSPS